MTQISIQFKISKKICLHSPFLYLTQVQWFYTTYNDFKRTRYFQNISSTFSPAVSSPSEVILFLGTHWFIDIYIVNACVQHYNNMKEGSNQEKHLKIHTYQVCVCVKENVLKDADQLKRQIYSENKIRKICLIW